MSELKTCATLNCGFKFLVSIPSIYCFPCRKIRKRAYEDEESSKHWKKGFTWRGRFRRNIPGG